MPQSFIDQSKESWIPADGRENANLDQLQLGCLQRIANASELMAKNYLHLQSDRDNYKKWYEERKVSNERMARRISALQGVITKMKRKLYTRKQSPV